MSLNIKDLVGLSKPLERLVEVIAAGLGAVSKPYLVKKEADARAYELKTIAQAMEESGKLLGPLRYDKGGVTVESEQIERDETTASTEERLVKRISYQANKKQRNLEAITQQAAEELKSETEVSDAPLDEDWISRFFSIAEDISNEQMQLLWGKILAGEVKKPKSYSLRTLDILKNLTRQEAETFVKVGRLALIAGNKGFIINPDRGGFLKSQYGIELIDVLLLRELNLVHDSDVGYIYSQLAEDSFDFYLYGGSVIVIERKAGTPKQKIDTIVLTATGCELISLVERPFDVAYVRKVATLLKRDGVTVKYGPVLEILPDGISYGELTEISLD